MKRITSLNDLLMEELGELLNAENQFAKVLPRMAEAGQSSELRSALENHTQIAIKQVNRLQKIFADIGQRPQSLVCRAMHALLDEGQAVIYATDKSPARDAGIIGAVQRVVHYEIAGYGTAREHAVDLGHTGIVELLNETLKEERAVNFHLNEMARDIINPRAAAGNLYSQEPAQKI